MAKNYKSASIRGKLRVHNYLASNKELQAYLPVSLPFTLKNLEKMLNSYSMIYCKPDFGSLGLGIYKIERKFPGYKLISTKGSSTFNSIPQLYNSLKKRTKGKTYLQQGIQLEKLNGRPYDIRIMFQRKPKGPWTCTGIVTKVGYPNKIVTNYYQGGELSTLEQTYKKNSLDEELIAQRTNQLVNVGLKIALTLSSKKAGMHEMGIDMAYDTNGHLWLIEVNSRSPQFYPMKKADPAMYRRMMSFAHSYGRKSSR